VKPKIILIVAFVLAFAAGGSVGLLAVRPPPPPPPRGVLMSKLNLTPEQREQMKMIWTEADGVHRQHWERRAALAQERDQQIRKLLDEGQLARYEAILQDYSRGLEELSRERTRSFEEARERTKKMLTPEQASRYEKLMQDAREHGPGGPGGRGGPGGPGGRGGPRGFYGSRRGTPATASRPTSMESGIPLVGE